MAVTATQVTTTQAVLDKADPDRHADAIGKANLGTMMTPLKRTFTGLTSSATQNLTTIDGTGEVVGSSNPKRLPALSVTTLRVTAGAATAGARVVTDAGGAAGAPGANGPGVALLSDDGSTLTFEAAVTGFVAEYIPRAAVDMTARFEIV